MTAVEPFGDQLERLLDEPVRAAEAREAARFAEIEGGRGRPVVILGAGKLGRRILRGLRDEGRDVMAFCDNDPGRHGAVVEGAPVMSPADAARRWGDEATFVVGVWRAEGGFRTPALRDQLRALGARRVALCAELFWSTPQTFLPYYALDLPSRLLAAAPEVRAAFRELHDARSREEFVAYVRWCLLADVGGMPEPVESGPMYFPAYLFALREDEGFVDVGAYDGDTARDLLSRTAGRVGHISCVEADPTSVRRLKLWAASLPPAHASRVSVHGVAAGAAAGVAIFDARGDVDSRISARGTETVPVRPLDDVIDARPATLIKFDVEGAEVDALRGSKRLLSEDRPAVAACVYHSQSHLWEVPNLLRGLLPDHRLFLRGYSQEVFDTVVYAVPRDRALE